MTLRPETEWVETVEAGWNVAAGTDPAAIAVGRIVEILADTVETCAHRR